MDVGMYIWAWLDLLFAGVGERVGDGMDGVVQSEGW